MLCNRCTRSALTDRFPQPPFICSHIPQSGTEVRVSRLKTKDGCTGTLRAGCCRTLPDSRLMPWTGIAESHPRAEESQQGQASFHDFARETEAEHDQTANTCHSARLVVACFRWNAGRSRCSVLIQNGTHGESGSGIGPRTIAMMR